MKQTSSTEFQRNFGQQLDRAQREPVAVTSKGRVRAVLISAEEYQRLRQLDRQALMVEQLSDRDLEAIGKAKMPEGLEHLNQELELQDADT